MRFVPGRKQAPYACRKVGGDAVLERLAPSQFHAIVNAVNGFEEVFVDFLVHHFGNMRLPHCVRSDLRKHLHTRGLMPHPPRESRREGSINVKTNQAEK